MNNGIIIITLKKKYKKVIKNNGKTYYLLTYNLQKALTNEYFELIGEKHLTLTDDCSWICSCFPDLSSHCPKGHHSKENETETNKFLFYILKDSFCKKLKNLVNDNLKS